MNKQVHLQHPLLDSKCALCGAVAAHSDDSTIAKPGEEVSCVDCRYVIDKCVQVYDQHYWRPL